MGAPQFTPGPWEVFHDECNYCHKQGDENWHVLSGPPLTEHGGFAKKADASLIAAAPDYDAASEMLLKWFDASGSSIDARWDRIPAQERAAIVAAFRAARAKARGDAA